MMMVRPVTVFRIHVGLDRVFLTGSVTRDFTAGAYALIRLDVRAGRDFLQKYLYRFRALLALERQYAGWFVSHVNS
jgi:hypothetical protein